MTKDRPANLAGRVRQRLGALLPGGNQPRASQDAGRETAQPSRYEKMVAAAEQAQGLDAQLEAWQRIVEVAPRRREACVRYGELLRDACLFEEAEAHYQQCLAHKPDARWAMVGQAKTATAARDYDVAVARWQELVSRYPDEDRYHGNLIKALVDVLDFDQAQALYDANCPAEPSVSYRMLQVEIHAARTERLEALALLEELHEADPSHQAVVGRMNTLLSQLFRNSGDAVFGERVLGLLDEYEATNGRTQWLLERRIDLYVLLDRPDEALALLQELPATDGEKNMALRAWARYVSGDLEGSKALWQDIARRYFPVLVRPPAPGTLQRTDTNPLAIDKDAILLFTAVRNERWRLPWFLEHYRALGVDSFFFVDNGSTDGTAEFLHAQPDVHVFWTDQSYAKAYSGMQWINGLVQTYGDDCWCMYADVDEALVFPGYETRGLRQLTQYLSDQGHEAVHAFMLDMYAPHLESVERDEHYMDFAQDYPLFENCYSKVSTIYCPFRYTAGGIRRTFKLNENQTKTPIIRGGRGIHFLMSSHLITPAKLSDVTAVMLHYKLAGDFEASFSNDLADNARIARCQMRHWRYLEALQDLCREQTFVGEHSVKLESSGQLVELGVLNTSPAFESGAYD